MKSKDDLVDVVRTAVAQAMFVDKTEVQPETRILGDLGAESIDLLDILFRIERETGAKIEIGDLSKHFQGNIPDTEFYDPRGRVTPVAFARLQETMPDIDFSAYGSEMTSEDLMKELTVNYVADRVAERIPQSAIEVS